MRLDRFIKPALLALTLAVFWPVDRCEFLQFDDPSYVTENPHVREMTLPNVGWAFRACVVGNWQPITLLSHMLDCRLFGLDAGWHHLVNLLFHVANTLLLFHLLRQWTRETWPSAIVAALFAVHPVHVESVAWISERKDVLCTFFGLLSLDAYARYAAKASPSSPPSAASKDRWWFSGDFWLALLFLALGLMSKPMLVTWPFVFLLFDFWPLRRLSGFGFGIGGLGNRGPSPLGRLIVEKLPFLGISIAAGIVAILAQRSQGLVMPLDQSAIPERLENALIALVRYLGKAVWPSHLAVYYPYRLGWPLWAIGGSVAVLSAISLAVSWQWKKRPALLFGWLWFLGTLVPVIGLVQVGSQSIADRYLYIPSIGLFVTIVWGAKDILTRLPRARASAATVLAGVVILACSVSTFSQLQYWKDGETLFLHALAVTGDNPVAEYGLAKALVKGGRVEEGLQHLERAATLNPRYVSALTKIADLQAGQGRIREAIDRYRQALRCDPDLPDPLNNLAWLLATSEEPGLRDGTEAVRLAQRACQLTRDEDPGFIDTLAAAYAEAGRFDLAIPTAERALAMALEAGQKERAARIQEALDLYRVGKPLHRQLERQPSAQISTPASPPRRSAD